MIGVSRALKPAPCRCRSARGEDPPACHVVFGLTDAALESLALEGNNTYLLWEVGKPPDFILEMGALSTAGEDLGNKRELYAELGVSEYWRYDGTGGDFYGEPLVGERLVDGEYRRVEMRRESGGRVWSHSAALNLELWWVGGEPRFWDPVAERWLLSHVEEHNRAEQERVGRIAAESRVAELETELRRLRGGWGPAGFTICGCWWNATAGAPRSRVWAGVPHVRTPPNPRRTFCSQMSYSLLALQMTGSTSIP